MGQNGKREFVFPFEKLEVWQLAVDLADFIFNLLIPALNMENDRN